MAAARERVCYVAGVEHADLLQKLKQVEDNAWMLFNELPPCGARTRALHVFLDAKQLKSQLEKINGEPHSSSSADQSGHR